MLEVRDTEVSDFIAWKNLMAEYYAFYHFVGYIFRQIETNLENNFHYNLEG